MKRKHKPKLYKRIAVVALLLVLPVLGFILWFFYPSYPSLPEPPLKDLAVRHEINLGSRVVSERVNDRIYPDLITAQFDYFGIFAETHYDDLHPAPEKYDFKQLDKLVGFAKEKQKPVQMFHLLWGEGNHLPDWLKNGDYSKDQIKEFNRDHIAKVAGHYKGRVESWSVVNEAFTREQHVYGLRDWFADNLGGGTQYIDDAYTWAREADPNAKLLLNDFNNEGENKVSNAMYDYIKSAKARGVPIDGLGMQMHINAANPPKKDEVIKNMQRFGAIGVPTYVTEFDINLNSVEGSSEYKRRLEAEITYDMVRACIESKSCVSFTEFGTTDKHDFIKKLTGADSHSFLLDSRFRPKPSFHKFRQAWLEP